MYGTVYRVTTGQNKSWIIITIITYQYDTTDNSIKTAHNVTKFQVKNQAQWKVSDHCSPIAIFKEFTQVDNIRMSTALNQDLNFLQHFHSTSFFGF